MRGVERMETKATHLEFSHQGLHGQEKVSSIAMSSVLFIQLSFDNRKQGVELF